MGSNVKKENVDAITGAGKLLMTIEERAKRLAKRDRINREKKNKPFSGNAKANELLGKKKVNKKSKNKPINDKQRKKFKSLFFVK